MAWKILLFEPTKKNSHPIIAGQIYTKSITKECAKDISNIFVTTKSNLLNNKEGDFISLDDKYSGGNLCHCDLW